MSRAKLSNDGNIKNIHYGDILLKLGNITDVEKEELSYVKYGAKLSKKISYLKSGDIVISDTAEDDTVGKATELINIHTPVISGLHTIACRPIIPFEKGFLGYYLNSSSYHNQLYPFMQGIKVISISKVNMALTSIHYPSLQEQRKISKLMLLIDKRIEKQEKLIECLKLYKKGLLNTVFSSVRDYKYTILGNICNIKTGNLNANAMQKNGIYRFYTCAKEFYCINTYAFDTDALLVSGNGANVGYIHHYCGKFNAYQRTYVLDGFKSANILYVQYYMELKLKERIENEKKSGNTSYIVLSTLSEMPIFLPSQEHQDKIGSLFASFDIRLKKEEDKLKSLLELKTGLLQQIFI